MTNFIDRLANFFRPHPHQESSSFPQQEPEDFVGLPPGFVPIESLCDMDQIPGTSRHIGSQLRIFQTPAPELVTANRRTGIRAGCGHPVFRIQQMVTPNGVEEGIGGFCRECELEASQLLQQQVITMARAEERALFCTACASHCDGCLRCDLCLRHTRLFQEPAGGLIPLCSVCYEQAEKERFLNKIITTAMLPFINRKRFR